MFFWLDLDSTVAATTDYHPLSNFGALNTCMKDSPLTHEVVGAPCTAGPGELWDFTKINDDGDFYIESSNGCLQTTEGSDNKRVIVGSCDNKSSSPRFQWHVLGVDKTVYKITSLDPDTVINGTYLLLRRDSKITIGLPNDPSDPTDTWWGYPVALFPYVTAGNVGISWRFN